MFPSGTEPFGNSSLMCLNISIDDDAIVEPTEVFFVCGTSAQPSVAILNGGCTNIKVKDNDGIEETGYNYVQYFHVLCFLFLQ